ncbi:MAG: sensor histidine kinase, partial [Candidatus Saccharimonadales bacterium]
VEEWHSSLTNPDETAKHRKVKTKYYVYADPDRLRELINNLFDNAIKFTEKGMIEVGLSGDHNNVTIYMRDSGVGVPAPDIPHLFQKFYRVDNTPTRTIGGTGLGLFICRKIVEMLGGRIWAESKLGEGSTFYISLPRLSDSEAKDLKTPKSLKRPVVFDVSKESNAQDNVLQESAKQA